MQVIAWWLPTCIIGLILAICGGFIMHILHPKITMFIIASSIIVESLLFALQPRHAGYWPWVFPAMCCVTISIDLMFNVTSVFFSTKLPARQQGLAGALTNTILAGSIALGLGFAQVVETKTAYQGERQSYKNVFWFNVALGAMALIIFMAFVRIDRAVSDSTADEKALAERNALEKLSDLQTAMNFRLADGETSATSTWTQESWIQPFDFERAEIRDRDAISELSRSISVYRASTQRSSRIFDQPPSPLDNVPPEVPTRDTDLRLEHPLLRRVPAVAKKTVSR